jgi:hypothetical protein
MSLDITLYKTTSSPDKGEIQKTLFEANITHNLGKMASEADLYLPLWRSEKTGINFASDLAEILKTKTFIMKAFPAYYKEFDSPNGWGTYEQFLRWLDKLLAACIEYPNARIETSH